jgi:hypothetical protein
MEELTFVDTVIKGLGWQIESGVEKEIQLTLYNWRVALVCDFTCSRLRDIAFGLRVLFKINCSI